MPDTRAIRVFVSSTFRDMQDEREELVKRVFPPIRRLCEQRGVAWSRGRPALGRDRRAEGRGRGAADLPRRDRSQPPVLHRPARPALRLGARGDARRSRRAAAWLRDLAGTIGDRDGDPPRRAQRPERRAARVLLPPRPGVDDSRVRPSSWPCSASSRARRVEALGTEVAERAASDDARRLDELRADPRQWCAGSTTATSDALGERVHADLVALVDRLYPIADVPDAAARETSAHDAYSAAQVRGTVRRPAIEAQLDTCGGRRACATDVSGPPGAGATEIAVAWLRPVARHTPRRRRHQPSRPSHRRRRAVECRWRTG